MTPRERADRAEHILKDEVFQQMFSDIREGFVAKLETVPVGDIDTQHEIALSLQILKQLKTQLTRYTQEIVVDNAAQRHESWIRRMKQTIAP